MLNKGEKMERLLRHFVRNPRGMKEKGTKLILHSYDAVLLSLLEPLFLFPRRCFIAVPQHRKKGHRAQSLLCICNSDIDDEAPFNFTGHTFFSFFG